MYREAGSEKPEGDHEYGMKSFRTFSKGQRIRVHISQLGYSGKRQLNGVHEWRYS